MDKPEYIPLPRTGTKCLYCGLSRSGIYNLIRPTKANGYKVLVASVVHGLPGKSRGRRLVNYASLVEYLNEQSVPVERRRLRRLWRQFRAQSLKGKVKVPSFIQQLRTSEDLPEDAVLHEEWLLISENTVRLHCMSHIYSMDTTPATSWFFS